MLSHMTFVISYRQFRSLRH